MLGVGRITGFWRFFGVGEVTVGEEEGVKGRNRTRRRGKRGGRGGGARPFANLSEKFLVDRERKSSSVVHLRRRISIDYWSWDFIVRFKRFICRVF